MGNSFCCHYFCEYENKKAEAAQKSPLKEAGFSVLRRVGIKIVF
jgi:hypothetical protein